MSLNKLLPAIAIFLLSTSVFASTKADQIDKQMGACIDKSGGVTSEMNDCIGTATTAMDKELNAIYVQLMKKLPPAKQTLLKDAQKKWLAFRDAELKFSWEVDPNEGGTAQGLTANSVNYEMLKARVKELQAYLSNFDLQ